MIPPKRTEYVKDKVISKTDVPNKHISFGTRINRNDVLCLKVKYKGKLVYSAGLSNFNCVTVDRDYMDGTAENIAEVLNDWHES